MKEKLKTLFANPLFIKYKFLIMPIFAILISILLVIFIVYPQILSGLQSQRQDTELKKKIELLNTKNQELEKIDDTTYKDYLNATLVAVPQDRDVSGVIGQVLFILNSNQLTVDDVGFGSVTEEKGVQAFQIRIEVTGDMADLRTLMNTIKSSPRILKITGLEINGNRNTSRIQATLSLTTYFQELPTVIGKVDQPLLSPTKQDLELLATLKDNIGTVPVVVETEDVSGPKGKPDPFQ